MPNHINYRLVISAIAVLVVGYALVRLRGDTRSTVPVTGGAPEAGATEYAIVTLLPRDAIRAIDDPSFYLAAQADDEYAPEELVLGVTLDGESRAYSTSFLDRHEIVNDTVGGRKIAVTW
jgi:hypothetical protein